MFNFTTVVFDGTSPTFIDKRYCRSQLKANSNEGKSDDTPSCFRPDLKEYTCTSNKYLPIRTVLQVAFSTLPLALIISADTKLNCNIHRLTGHEYPQV